jgi:hypothetical protein
MASGDKPKWKPREAEMHWCECCRVWLKNHPQVKLAHERGAKHKDALDRQLRDGQARADARTREEAATAAALKSIEAAAGARFAEDRASAAAAASAALGSWEPQPSTGYYYNARHRWYYDKGSRQYYGGEPAAWTAAPPIPREARYESMRAAALGGGGAEAGGAAPAAAAASRPAAAAAGGGAVLPGMQAAARHPQAGVGGYQMPLAGRIGGAKGVGFAAPDGRRDAGASAAAAPTPGKRKREKGDKGGGAAAPPAEAVSKEEAEFRARREAARARVSARSAAAFGLQ